MGKVKHTENLSMMRAMRGCTSDELHRNIGPISTDPHPCNGRRFMFQSSSSIQRGTSIRFLCALGGGTTTRREYARHTEVRCDRCTDMIDFPVVRILNMQHSFISAHRFRLSYG